MAHSGLELATFGLQSKRVPNWDTSGDMWSGIQTSTVQSYSELKLYMSLRHSWMMILYKNMYERVIVDMNI